MGGNETSGGEPPLAIGATLTKVDARVIRPDFGAASGPLPAQQVADVHPRILNRRLVCEPAPERPFEDAYDLARTKLEELEGLVLKLAGTPGLEALATYTASLRELRAGLARAAAGDAVAITHLPSTGQAVVGLFMAVQYVVAVRHSKAAGGAAL